jgi:hypothetical protein
VRGFELGKPNDGDPEEYEREKSTGAEATKRAVKDSGVTDAYAGCCGLSEIGCGCSCLG